MAGNIRAVDQENIVRLALWKGKKRSQVLRREEVIRVEERVISWGF